MKFSIRFIIELTAVFATCLAAYMGQGVLDDRHIAGGVFLFAVLCGVRSVMTALNFRGVKKFVLTVLSATLLVVLHLEFVQETRSFPYQSTPWYHGDRLDAFFSGVVMFVWYYIIAEFFRILFCSFFSDQLDPPKAGSRSETL